jgi:hypothetical protein
MACGGVVRKKKKKQTKKQSHNSIGRSILGKAQIL